MTDCEGVRGLLSAELDDELPAEAAAVVARHLQRCAACATEHHQLATVRSLVRAMPSRRVPNAVRDALLAEAGVRESAGRVRQLVVAGALVGAVLAGGAVGIRDDGPRTAPVPVDTLVTEHLAVSGPAAGLVGADR